MRAPLSAGVLLLVLALQPQISMVSAEEATTDLTLYAHTTETGDRVLSLSGNTTLRHSADLRDGLAFLLVPPLSKSLHLLGGFDIYVWLESQPNVQGTVALVTVGGFMGVAGAAVIAQVIRGADPVPILNIIAPLAFGVIAFYFGSKKAAA